ncbi:MAG: transcription termination factor NusA [Phycisphaerales bacterium]|nr:transcription termination factor NusA [Planctomycetota bacterium]MBL6996909.1 transcription termination factor NusA [Phycisphaerales bacterium]
MNRDTIELIDVIAKQRKIDKTAIIEDLEQAMVSAARKHFNSLDTEEFSCNMDLMTGEIRIWRHLDGGAVEIPLEELGRIPAQTAKQVMIQRFREDERTGIFDEYIDKAGELTTGVCSRYEGGSLIIQLDKGGRVEGFMPRSEQIPGEQFRPGDRVRCFILDVRDTGSQVKIVLSRSHPDFIRRLFEAEVPEVQEHVIEIHAMSREPGFRTKIAVTSNDSKVDPVGACVGVRGSRIRNIVEELGGEKIDIVRWNESSQVLISNALKPAEVDEVSLCFELGRATIIVRDDQLSLAIGRRGQNVRLAARLTGWDIDILTPEEYQKGLEILWDALKPIEGVTEEMLDRMAAMGIISIFDVEEIGRNVLEEDLEFSKQIADRCIDKSITRSKEVTIEQEQAKLAEEAVRAEEEAAASAVLDTEVDEKIEAAADSILDMSADDEVPEELDNAEVAASTETEESNE